MQIPSHKNRKNKGLRVITLTASAFIFFMWGILPASAYYITPTTYNSIDDVVTGVFGGPSYGGYFECYISYEPTGEAANGGCGTVEDGFLRICEVIGDCLSGSTDPGPGDGWLFTSPGDFHIMVASSTEFGTEAQDWYSYCSINTYEDCVTYGGPTDDILIDFINTPTSTTTSTTTQNNAVETNFAIFTALFLVMFSGTFILVNKFT